MARKGGGAPAIAELKTFIGSKDYAQSRAFYKALGFRVDYEDDGLAILSLGGWRFYLQRYYQADWCNNTMMHAVVEDAEAWFEHAQAVIGGGDFGPARVAPPKEEPYGALVTYLWDPAGVLWHLAEPIRE